MQWTEPTDGKKTLRVARTHLFRSKEKKEEKGESKGKTRTADSSAKLRCGWATRDNGQRHRTKILGEDYVNG